MRILLSILVPLMSLAIALPAQEASRRINVEFVEFDLDNGLHVILHRSARAPVATINVWYHVGSKNEREKRTGFAHLFEHMMFQGSENVPENGHFKHVQQAGGTLNGSTTQDRTNYFETLPANQLELGLWLESDRMRSLAVTQRNLDNQRDVVKEERRTRVDNVPYGRMNETLFATAYTAQAYKWPVIGSMEDLSAASLEDVKAFHAMYYVPNNASLCIAGDIDYDRTRDLVKKYFADIPRGAAEPYVPATVEPPQTAARRETMTDNVRLPAMMIAFHIPDMNHPDFDALDMLGDILSSGRSSRLYQRLVYRDRLAQSVMGGPYDLEQPGLFIFRVTAQMGKKLEDIEAAIWEEIGKAQEDLVAEEEIAKIRNRREMGFAGQLNTSQSIANNLNSCYILQKGTARINTQLDRIAAVTREDIRRTARAYLTRENSTTLTCLPKGKGK